MHRDTATVFPRQRFFLGPRLGEHVVKGKRTTGADVEAFVRRAKGAARRARRPLSLDDVLAETRAEKKPLSRENRRRVAVHEAGHAIISCVLKVGALLGVSLHDEGGLTAIDPVFDGSTTLRTLEDLMTFILAGRSAEELVFGEITLGSGFSDTSDLARATQIARSIELRSGFGDLGNVYVEESVVDDLVRIPGLIGAVKKRLDNAAARASAILAEHRTTLERIAQSLEKNGYLSCDDVDALLADDGASPSVWCSADASIAISPQEERHD
jgi:ATP-dependent Zn protease